MTVFIVSCVGLMSVHFIKYKLVKNVFEHFSIFLRAILQDEFVSLRLSFDRSSLNGGPVVRTKPRVATVTVHVA